MVMFKSFFAGVGSMSSVILAACALALTFGLIEVGVTQPATTVKSQTVPHWESAVDACLSIPSSGLIVEREAKAVHR